MGELEKMLENLEGQYEDYCAMRQLSLEQKACIGCEDLVGLNSSFGRMHRLMDRIRLRQRELPAPPWRLEIPELERRLQAIRSLISELQELRRVNEAGVRRLMKGARGALKQLQQGRRATQGYRHARVQGARFFDGRR